MKIQTKILVGFLLIIFFSFVSVAIGIVLQTHVLDRARQVQEVETPLEFMARDILILDSMLTNEVQISLLYAQNDEFNKFYASKARYEYLTMEMDYLLSRDIRLLLRQSQRSEELAYKAITALDEIERTNKVLADMETKAFNAMIEKDFQTAYEIIAGNEYKSHKNDIYNNYNEFAGIEAEITASKRAYIFRVAQRLIMVDFAIGLAIAFIIIVTLFVVRSFLIKIKEK
jgi:hypothetical protein